MDKKEPAMPSSQGDLALLNEPVAQALLQSTIPARLAYVSRDGTPRVVPIWFHWTGKAFVLGTPLTAPKVKSLQSNPKVALTIDGDVFPYKVLQVRGTAQIETVDDIAPEYAIAAERYFGAAQGQVWIEQVREMFPQMARIVIQPEWVGILDFERRFPSAIEVAMSGE
jgi:general stress protein 26